jgi:hypothetical protein
MEELEWSDVVKLFDKIIAEEASNG